MYFFKICVVAIVNSPKVPYIPFLSIGMGKELLKYPNVKEMYNIASQILGFDLLEICLSGPSKQLEKTIYQQPAIVVSSLAAVEK